MIERIDPPKPGKSPFSGAVLAGPLVFVSGQVGTDPKTGTTASGLKAQTQNALANIRGTLSKAGCSLKDVVKATVFLADIGGFDELNEVYRAAFAPDFPARSTIEAHLARPEFLVEIEVIAFRPHGPEELSRDGSVATATRRTSYTRRRIPGTPWTRSFPTSRGSHG